MYESLNIREQRPTIISISREIESSTEIESSEEENMAPLLHTLRGTRVIESYEDLVPPLLTRLRTRLTDCSFLEVCWCFSIIVYLCAVLCIAVNLLSVFRSFMHHSDQALLIACLVVLAETEWSYVLKFLQVFEYWIGRGMLQIFVAIMTRAFADDSGEPEELVLVQKIACYMLLACGVVYVFWEILWFGILKRPRQKQISREQAVKELKELQKRREELEQLLRTQQG